MEHEELKKLKNYSINLDDLWIVLIEHGQRDWQFKLGETIKYAPSEIIQIVKHYIDTGEW